MKRTRPKYPTPAQSAKRYLWAGSFDRCWICNRRRGEVMAFNIHEIGSRAQAPNKWADVRNYFFCCRSCHDGILASMPEVQQLAFKLWNDPDNYDRSFINQIRGRADTAIEECEVKRWLTLFQAIRG